MPAVFLGLGLASLALVIATNRIHVRLIDDDQSRINALQRVENSLTMAHLRLEEYVGGDDLDLTRSADRLERASALIAAMLGQDRDALSGDEAPLMTAELRERAVALLEGVGRMAELSRRRQQAHAAGDPPVARSRISAEYHSLFVELVRQSRELVALLDARRVHNLKRASRWFRTSVIVWPFIVGLATIGLWSRERRRLRAQAELRESLEQLHQSRKMEAVGRLAGGMAHDINNYLGAIRAQSEVVKMRSGGDEVLARKMDGIMQVVDKAAHLIERLLAFGRKQPMQPLVVNLNSVVREDLVSLLGGLVAEHVELETVLQKGLWDVEIDPSQFEQVLVNLVLNASEAMTERGIVKIETRNTRLDENAARTRGLNGPADYVMISVSDSGPGIPVENRHKVFEPFFTTKGMSKSSGLGLSTVYGIVEQNGGAVSLESEIGRGATFTIFLPRSSARFVYREDPAASASEASVARGTVLLVEDNTELRTSTASMIESLGYDVVAAEDAEQGLRRYDEIGERVNLVVTDVVMPGSGGKTLVDRIRQRRADQKVLYISGYTEAHLLSADIAPDGVVLRKPFSAADLGAKISETLRSS